MKIVVFGLTVSSSWGNGHATLWRGARPGPGSAAGTRSRSSSATCPTTPRTATDRASRRHRARPVRRPGPRSARRAAAQLAACRRRDGHLVLPGRPRRRQRSSLEPRPARVFYDLDTPVTLARLAAGEAVPYLPARGLGDFDLVLSLHGRRALDAAPRPVSARGASRRCTAASIPPPTARPPARAAFRGDLSYLGTYSQDRQRALERAVPRARPTALPDRTFVVAGALYPSASRGRPNMYFVRHLPPADHPAFFCSSPPHPERDPRADGGDGLLPFRAAVRGGGVRHAGGHRRWEGLDAFFTPGERDPGGATTPTTCSLRSDDRRRSWRRIGRRARERALAQHTADRRARASSRPLLEDARGRRPLRSERGGA